MTHTGHAASVISNRRGLEMDLRPWPEVIDIYNREHPDSPMNVNTARKMASAALVKLRRKVPLVVLEAVAKDYLGKETPYASK